MAAGEKNAVKASRNPAAGPRRVSNLCLKLLAFCFATLPFTSPAQGRTNFLGFETNGPAVVRVFEIAYEQVQTNVLKTFLRTNNGIRSVERVWGLRTNSFSMTNRAFAHLKEDSFTHMIWTNVLARTNGRTTQIWSERRHPENWPKSKPIVKWNPDSLVYGMRGFTALSPCWEAEGNSGQVPITALTRRHGYTRGHGMGPSGFSQRFAGKKVWFLTEQNRLIEARVVREVVRTYQPDGRDYTILLFNRDLPDSIQPLRVIAPATVQAAYAPIPGAPRPLFFPEQGGHVSAELPGFTVPTWKGGDSGSANLLPLGNELIFVGGRSTSGPSSEMQSDMDELCRMQRLNPKNYPFQWANSEIW